MKKVDDGGETRKTQNMGEIVATNVISSHCLNGKACRRLCRFEHIPKLDLKDP